MISNMIRIEKDTETGVMAIRYIRTCEEIMVTSLIPLTLLSLDFPHLIGYRMLKVLFNKSVLLAICNAENIK